MNFFGSLKKASVFIFVLIIGIVLTGCGDTEVSTEGASSPNPDKLKPTGNLVITYTDATTGEPIVGAVIDLGLAVARTNSRGVATFKNIPATTDASGSANVTGTYSANVDFSEVTRPINMRSASASVKYPLLINKTNITVEYATLEDASTLPNLGGAGAVAASNAGNYDTPVTGLVGSQNWTVGKLSTSVSGEIRDKKSNDLVTEPYLVNLWDGGVLLQTLTTINSAFSFSAVAANQALELTAENASNSMKGTRTFTSPEDGRAISLTVGGQVQPILVNEQDLADPWVTMISFNDGTTTFENTADIGTTSTIDVMFGFSEPMIASFYNTSTSTVASSGVDTIGDDVEVIFTGSKAGDVAYSMSWNTEMTQLTVTIPNLAVSANYEVKILAAAAAVGRLTDVNDEKLDIDASAGSDGTDIVAKFSTSGGVTLTAHTDLAMVTANVDSNTGTINLDWTWQAGAAGYNIYRSSTTGSGATAFNSRSYEELALDHNVSSYDDATVNFIDGELPVSYAYVIRAINSDGAETTDSNSVPASDITSVPMTGVVAFSDVDLDGNCETTTVTFGEAVAEMAAEVAGSYAYAMGTTQNATKTATAAVLKTSTTVELTFEDNSACVDFTDDADNTEALTVSAVTDLAGNIIDNAANVWHQDSDTID